MLPFVPPVEFAAESAAAPTAECVDAADRGQRARKDGKLQDARDHFLSCAAPMCPESVQKDCLHWANDTIDLVPSIVIDATDEDGHDIGDAKVSIDGYEAASVTEGRSITLDPGPHAVRVEKSGFYPVDQRIIAKEGVHARRVQAVLVRPRIEPRDSAGVTRPENATHPTWVFALTGIGAATLTAGLLVVAGSSEIQRSDDKDVVRGLGWTSIVVGGAATITGLFAYFSEPAKPRMRAGVTITPVGAFGRF